jgi:hypothetical protein
MMVENLKNIRRIEMARENKHTVRSKKRPGPVARVIDKAKDISDIMTEAGRKIKRGGKPSEKKPTPRYKANKTSKNSRKY